MIVLSFVSYRTCPSTFDEKLMFTDPASAKILKVLQLSIE